MEKNENYNINRFKPKKNYFFFSLLSIFFRFLLQLYFISQMDILKQLIARALTLIVWPIMLYLAFFYIHLSILNHSGNGDGFYSSAFQSQLIGNSLHNATMPRQVAYGALLTIKNFKTGGGYLHSHYHLYPKGAGARQQQVRLTLILILIKKWKRRYERRFSLSFFFVSFLSHLISEYRRCVKNHMKLFFLCLFFLKIKRKQK